MVTGIATRLACFALISSIEEDIRSKIQTLARQLATDSFLPPDVRENAAIRCQADLPDYEIQGDSDLLHYMDFGDLSKTLYVLAPSQSSHDRTHIEEMAQRLISLAPTRNRVCHSRPLELDDFSTLLDFATELTKNKYFATSAVVACLSQMERDPKFVLGLTIPSYWASLDEGIQNNLPQADFDETGFIGRDKDRREVKRLLLSANLVITIVGEGGVGKTALALRCLYDLLDEPNPPFDAIIWTSLKSKTLTVTGINEVKRDIDSVLGLATAIASSLNPQELKFPDISSAFEHIRNDLSSFRVLLAIDNAETLALENLRPLLITIPAGSKVLMTSRVGIGEVEVRYQLDKLDEESAIKLSRVYAKTLNVSAMLKASNQTLKDICRALYFNPLLIKWHISAVSAGADPVSVISRKDVNFLNALRYCFENLFERLSLDEKRILHTLASVKRPATRVELSYLVSDLGEDAIAWALNTLHKSSMIRRGFSPAVGGRSSSTYALSEIAADYIETVAPPSAELFKRTKELQKQLQIATQQDAVSQSQHELEPFSVFAASQDERICAALLRSSLNLLKKQEFADALLFIEKAKQMMPDYSENYRISGLINEKKGDYFQASGDFSHAIELSPNSVISHYTYGTFLLYKLDDAALALNHFSRANELSPGLRPILSLHARCLVFLGRYDEAAKYFDSILSEIPKSSVGKWRSAAYDQAAECYRRWLEADVRLQDVNSMRSHVERVLAILTDAIESKDFDMQMYERATYVVGECVSAMSFMPDRASAERIIAFIRKYNGTTFASKRKLVVHSQLSFVKTLRLAGLPDVEFSDSIIFEKEASAHDIARVTKNGVIRFRLVDKGFGTILDDEGHEWFFNKKAFGTNTEWLNALPGKRVSFAVGQNYRGPCATKVVLS